MTGMHWLLVPGAALAVAGGVVVWALIVTIVVDTLQRRHVDRPRPPSDRTDRAETRSDDLLTPVH